MSRYDCFWLFTCSRITPQAKESLGWKDELNKPLLFSIIFNRKCHRVVEKNLMAKFFSQCFHKKLRIASNRLWINLSSFFEFFHFLATLGQKARSVFSRLFSAIFSEVWWFDFYHLTLFNPRGLLSLQLRRVNMAQWVMLLLVWASVNFVISSKYVLLAQLDFFDLQLRSSTKIVSGPGSPLGLNRLQKIRIENGWSSQQGL